MSRRTDYEREHTPDVMVPPINEKPYYVARLARIIRNGKYGGEEYLDRLKLSSLKLLDAHHSPLDLDLNTLKRYDEIDLRNVLLLSGLGNNAKHQLGSIKESCEVIQRHHEIDSEDLTKIDTRQADMIAAAVHFLCETKFMEYAPPRLTHFVMSNTDRVDDIIEYLNENGIRKDKAHHIDVEHLSDFINADAPAVREGIL